MNEQSSLDFTTSFSLRLMNHPELLTFSLGYSQILKLHELCRIGHFFGSLGGSLARWLIGYLQKPTMKSLLISSISI